MEFPSQSWCVHEMLPTLLCTASPLWCKCSYIVPFSEKGIQYTMKSRIGNEGRRDMIPTIGDVREAGLSVLWLPPEFPFLFGSNIYPINHIFTYLLECLTKMYNLVTRYWGQKLKFIVFLYATTEEKYSSIPKVQRGRFATTPRHTRHVFLGIPFPGIPHGFNREASYAIGHTDFFRADHPAVFLTLGLCQYREQQLQPRFRLIRKHWLQVLKKKRNIGLLALSLVFGLLGSLLTNLIFSSVYTNASCMVGKYFFQIWLLSSSRPGKPCDLGQGISSLWKWVQWQLIELVLRLRQHSRHSLRGDCFSCLSSV